MSVDPVDLIARTLLYEGYLLYPYRPSALKNRQRFTFGVLYPESYCRVHGGGSDARQLQMECPLQGGPQTHLEIEVRFLQLVERHSKDCPDSSWQEAIERHVRLDAGSLSGLGRTGARLAFEFPASDARAMNVDCSTAGRPASVEPAVRGDVRASVDEVQPGVFKLTVRVRNLAPLDAAATRDEALLRSLASAHAVIEVVGGELISLLDPPEEFRELAASCSNVGVWPVLVGEEGSRDRMLASPIILYDYPQIAPESDGDLFDGTEIDEILALRILTMTDEEKREARESDDRARQILDRTEGFAPEHWARLHGAVRGLRKVTEGTP